MCIIIVYLMDVCIVCIVMCCGCVFHGFVCVMVVCNVFLLCVMYWGCVSPLCVIYCGCLYCGCVYHRCV